MHCKNSYTVPEYMKKSLIPCLRSGEQRLMKIMEMTNASV